MRRLFDLSLVTDGREHELSTRVERLFVQVLLPAADEGDDAGDPLRRLVIWGSEPRQRTVELRDHISAAALLDEDLTKAVHVILMETPSEELMEMSQKLDAVAGALRAYAQEVSVRMARTETQSAG